MAQRNTEFAYHNIELYKSETFGSGSYGGVCKAKCDGLLCAAKIMHPTLFDIRDSGTESYLHKFREECHLLSLARHPNVVQYLATYYDPDTRLPVLLMELCDESLTSFLKRSRETLSYHIQVNIGHDITLALVYLHSNGLIHRDLTGNNVLIIAGTRAKITDFGMSKLAPVNAFMTVLTTCPGTVVYMSPEALDEAKTYTCKLDIFSFGVLVIQILTRLFPNPTDRFRFVSVPNYQEPLRELISEQQRRETHLKLIPDTHFLKPLALECLEKEKQRPSALQLSERLSELKQSTQYTESLHQIQSHNDIQQQHRMSTEAMRSEIQEHQTQNAELQVIVETKERQLQIKDNLLQENQAVIQAMERQFDAKDKLLQENQVVIQAKDRQLQECQHTICSGEHAVETKERELQEQLQCIEQLQQSLLQKEKTITDLQEIVSAHEKKIQQLEKQYEPKRKPSTFTQKMMAAFQKDISKMVWREGKNAPGKMTRGAAVVHENTIYITPVGSYKVHSYQNILGEEQWSQLPDNPNKNCGLAVINGVLTSVGGYNNDYTNVLFSLTGEDTRKQWSEIFPHMPTPRRSVACITTEQSLVVAGGCKNDFRLDVVEVMNINTREWTKVSPLPEKQYALSVTACGDTLYLAGGIDSEPSKSVFTCSLPVLLGSSNSLGSKKRHTVFQSQNVWKEISSLPAGRSTLASFNGQLLAIGGWDDSSTRNYTTNVYTYDFQTDSWNVISQMKNKRSSCLAVTLQEDHLIVVGGYTESGNATDSVEILE